MADNPISGCKETDSLSKIPDGARLKNGKIVLNKTEDEHSILNQADGLLNVFNVRGNTPKGKIYFYQARFNGTSGPVFAEYDVKTDVFKLLDNNASWNMELAIFLEQEFRRLMPSFYTQVQQKERLNMPEDAVLKKGTLTVHAAGQSYTFIVTPSMTRSGVEFLDISIGWTIPYVNKQAGFYVPDMGEFRLAQGREKEPWGKRGVLERAFRKHFTEFYEINEAENSQLDSLD